MIKLPIYKYYSNFFTLGNFVLAKDKETGQYENLGEPKEGQIGDYDQIDIDDETGEITLIKEGNKPK